MTAGAERTIFYVADIHGSDVCFRKWLNAGRFYGADVLVIGGDLTGKVLLPIYPAPGGNGSWTATWRGRPVHLETRTEVDELIRTARDEGSYGYVTTVDEVAAIQASPDLERSTFTRLKLDALADWMRLADQRLADGSIRAVVMAGNDDPPEIDAVLATSTRLEDVGGEVVEIAPGIHMASVGELTPTPWHTPASFPTMSWVAGSPGRSIGCHRAAWPSGISTCRRTPPGSTRPRNSMKGYGSSTTRAASRGCGRSAASRSGGSSKRGSRRSPCTATSTRVAVATSSGAPSGSIPAVSIRTAS